MTTDGGRARRTGRARRQLALGALLLCAAGCLRTRTRYVVPLNPEPAHAPPVEREPAAARAERDGPPAVAMRGVDFHVAPDVVLRVRRLSGTLVAIPSGEPVVFDDKRSFAIHIAAADVGISTASLTRLLNGYVFAYEGAPLTDFTVRVDGAELRLRATLHKGPDLPIEIVGALAATKSGEIRVRPTSIRVARLPTGPLLRLTGLKLDRLVSLRGARGARLVGNDILLLPDSILPPPHVHGRLVDARTAGDEVRLRFDDPALAADAAAADAPPVAAENYLYFRGGTVRIGKLFMVHADLELIDDAPADPFDFSLDEYARQLAAGYVKVTMARGLVVRVPDLRSLAAGRTAASTAP